MRPKLLYLWQVALFLAAGSRRSVDAMVLVDHEADDLLKLLQKQYNPTSRLEKESSLLACQACRHFLQDYSPFTANFPSAKCTSSHLDQNFPLVPSHASHSLPDVLPHN